MELFACLRYGIENGGAYGENVRAFCLQLHFFSPRAYEFVRSQFNNHLPHCSTIQAWYRNSDLDAESGISESSLRILKCKANEMTSKNQTAIFSLSFDEMAIRKHQQWCNKTKTFLGNVTYGDSSEVASNAIVFLARGLNTDIKVPIAYYFITNITAEQRKAILLQILDRLFKNDINISNITFDGLAANARMCELLGASLQGEDMRTYFIEPQSKKKIYIIFDPSHAIKLLRNSLASRQVFFDNHNSQIKWSFFETLLEVGKNNDFGLTHTLSNDHIHFFNRKMNVRIAVQTLSNKTANSMQFLMDRGVEGFADASATILFIKNVNDIFDVMNSQKIDHNQDNIFKSAINFHNNENIFSFMLKVQEYIRGLKCMSPKGGIVPILKSNIKTGFRGFLINIKSVMGMYNEYVDEHQYLIMIATYKLSQDFLEMLFHRIRSIHRCNDNPTAQQYIASYKRVQMISMLTEILPSSSANILTLPLNILNIPSTHETHEMEYQIDASTQLENIENPLDVEHVEQCNYLLDQCNKSGIIFTAYLIEQGILTRGRIYCLMCKNAILFSEKVEARDCVGKNISCKSTLQICKATDLAMKEFICFSDKNVVHKIISRVMSMLEMNKLYTPYYDTHDITHKHYLIRYIITNYIQKKCTYLSKQRNVEMHKNYLRHVHRKAVHFAGH